MFAFCFQLIENKAKCFMNVNVLKTNVYRIQYYYLIYLKASVFRGFSTLSAPPVNGGVPKANGPVPNEM